MLSIPFTFNQTLFHPLFFITHTCIIGIAWHATQAHLFFAVLGITLITALYCTQLYKTSTLILCMLASFGVGAYRHYAIQTKHNHTLAQLTATPRTIVATVTDSIPIDHPFYKQRLTVLVEHNLFFIYTKACSDINVDDTLMMRDIVIKKPSSSSYANYLLKEGITATLFVPTLDYTRLHRPHYSCARWIHALKNNTLHTLAHKMEERVYHLFASLFLGNKPIPKKIVEYSREHFNTWGVAHYLARSGLHMIIIGMVWHILVSFLPMSYTLRTILLIILSGLYGLLSWPTVSFNRALISFIVYKFCDVLYMPTNFLHTVTVVCLAVILYNPLHVFFLDFQLSFGLTCALALFSHLKQKSPNY